MEGAGLTSIKVNGFNEVYHGGTEKVELVTGHPSNCNTGRMADPLYIPSTIF
jgi:hypothetical protein